MGDAVVVTTVVRLTEVGGVQVVTVPAMWILTAAATEHEHGGEAVCKREE